MPDLDYCHSASAKTSGTGPEFYLFQRQETARIALVTDPTGFYPDDKVIKFETREGDMQSLSPNTCRSEGQGHRVIKAGETYWWETDLWIPSTVPKVSSTGFLTLMSIFGLPGSGSSPFRWDIKNDKLGHSTIGNDRAWQSSASAKETYYGKWLTFTTKTRMSTTGSSADGYVEAWLRAGEAAKKQLTFWKPGECQNNEGHGPESTKWTYNSMPTSIASDTHVKLDQYRREAMPGWGNEAFYFTSLRVATTEASVANPFSFSYDAPEEPEEPPPEEPASVPSALINPSRRAVRGLILR